jgi:hypothetical protein
MHQALRVIIIGTVHIIFFFSCHCYNTLRCICTCYKIHRWLRSHGMFLEQHWVMRQSNTPLLADAQKLAKLAKPVSNTVCNVLRISKQALCQKYAALVKNRLLYGGHDQANSNIKVWRCLWIPAMYLKEKMPWSSPNFTWVPL